ncbi:MAG: hypothetical protein GY797_26070 [Deltaproteobacteria bacterium]|nr:hypothetical protein [Deltaproteobacteria bacterium]
MQDQIRRKFIIDSAKITGAVISTATLGKELLLPQTSKAANVQFSDSDRGSKNKVGHKILIAYASKFGTTGEVAEAIGEVLYQDGNSVETKWIKNVKDLNNFDAIIIGSAIQYDRWMPEATEFVTANKSILSKLPVAYFFTCLTLFKRTKKAENKAMTYSDKLYSLVPQVKPVSVGRFAGVLDYSNMSFFIRLVAKGIFAIIRVPEGDYRNWDAIRSWAKRLSF